MKLQKPFSGNHIITQAFGENLNGYYASEGLLGHQGLDFAMPIGTPLFSSVKGTVVAVSLDIQRGEGVSIMSDDLFTYKGQSCKFIVLVWHLKDKSIVVKVGDNVEAGQFLGLSGNTGQTTGPHLHYSIMPIAPDGSRRPLEPNNGYRSCVDPIPYLDLPATIKMVQFSHTWNIPLQRVKDFQAKHGLVADGIVGPKTQSIVDTLI